MEYIELNHKTTYNYISSLANTHFRSGAKICPTTAVTTTQPQCHCHCYTMHVLRNTDYGSAAHRKPNVEQIPIRYDFYYSGWDYIGKMLDEFGLINMNGRCYDPVVGRFLSPDIIVQNANITQCYNRYSYAVNNPLKYTDPSGWSYGTLAQMHNAEQRAAWQEMQARNRQLQHELQISNPKEARILSLGLHGKNGLGGTADGTFFSDIQSIVRVLQILGLPGVFGNPEEEGADYQSTTQETETIYVQNPGPYVIYFKPEQTMTINGVEYKDDGAYPLMPGQSWNYPVDGVKTQLHDDQVYKVPGKYGFYGDVTIDKEGNVDLDFYGLGPFLDIFYGWQDQLPAENWRNLWNSKPYKP